MESEAHTFAGRLALLPGIRHLRRRAYDRRFAANRGENLFRGVFPSAEAALASAPASRPLGYDNEEAATMYAPRRRPETYDYPAMFWLDRAIRAGARRIFDVGGHVGLHYYAFRDCLDYPVDLHWTVCDVTAVVDRGRRIAEERGVSAQLAFTDDYAALDGADLLLASGSLQYLPMTLADWLRGVSRPPPRIVVNTTPMHPAKDFYTLNSIGTAFCPYRVVHEAGFVKALDSLGYRATDRWANPGKGLHIPFQEGHDVPAYRGAYFERMTGQ